MAVVPARLKAALAIVAVALAASVAQAFRPASEGSPKGLRYDRGSPQGLRYNGDGPDGRRYNGGGPEGLRYDRQVDGYGLSAAAQALPANTQELPRRIISLIPATTEMLFAIGAGDRVAAVSNYDRFPAEVARLPKVGGLLDPDVERVLSLKPDLVIVYDTQTDLKRQLERAQVPMFPYAHRGLPDITETMRALGARVGAKAAADAAAARIEQELAAVGRRVAGRTRPKTLLVFGREPGTLRHVMASGGYGFLHDVLQIAGGDDVLGEMRRQSVDLSTEMILTRAPEVIIELHYGGDMKPERFEAERQVWKALPSVPAVRNDRIYLLDGQEFVVPGPRIVVAAERFARTLHPEAFR